jgi:hypothetical protein
VKIDNAADGAFDRAGTRGQTIIADYSNLKNPTCQIGSQFTHLCLCQIYFVEAVVLPPAPVDFFFETQDTQEMHILRWA